MELHGENLIGNGRSADGAETLRASAPATGETLSPSFRLATGGEIDRALELADAAFPIYRSLSAEARADFLERIGEEIQALGDALIARAHAETALPTARLTGERTRTVNQLRMFATTLREGSWVEARIDRAQPARQPAPRPDLRRMMIPLGPVGVFSASNFPFAFSVAGGDTASALAAGCPVVVKAHPAHPGTSEMTARAVVLAAQKTQMPTGVFALLHGGHEVGRALVQHPRLQAVGFTGSLRAGRALADAVSARRRPIPLYAEMGSINPIFVLPEALAARGGAIAAGLAQSVTLGAGQFCTNPGLVVGLRSPEMDRFLQEVTAQIVKATPGSMLYQEIYRAYVASTERLAATGVVRLEGGAEPPGDPARAQAAAAVFSTSAAGFLQNPQLAEEVFGPCTLVVICDTTDEMERVARHLEGQLTATLHGTPADLSRFQGLAAVLETKVGRLIVNGFPTGVEVSPAMQHGGPYPATSHSHFTSVGTAAIQRFVRPLCYQDCPQELLPAELRNENPRAVWRLVDGEWTREAITD